MSRLIRILVVCQPKLMREAKLAVFACQPDVEIVGEASNDAEICEGVRQTLPDLLVVTMDHSGKRSAICVTLLYAYPDMRIISVSSRKNHVAYYWATLQIRSKNSEESML